MLVEAVDRGIIKKAQAIQLKQHLLSNRNAIASMPDHQTHFENTLAIGLKVLRITKRLLVDTKHERSQHGLMTNDSLHLGTMNRHSAPLADIATHDSDFGHIPAITVWEPRDVV